MGTWSTVSVNTFCGSVLPVMDADSGSAYKAASFNSCISHRFRIPIALFHPSICAPG